MSTSRPNSNVFYALIMHIGAVMIVLGIQEPANPLLIIGGIGMWAGVAVSTLK